MKKVAVIELIKKAKIEKTPGAKRYPPAVIKAVKKLERGKIYEVTKNHPRASKEVKFLGILSHFYRTGLRMKILAKDKGTQYPKKNIATFPFGIFDPENGPFTFKKVHEKDLPLYLDMEATPHMERFFKEA